MNQIRNNAANVKQLAFGIALMFPLIAFGGDNPMNLDGSNQRISVTKIKSVMFDGKRVVAVKNRIEEVANRLCEQFGGRQRNRNAATNLVVRKLLLLRLNSEYIVDLLPLPFKVTV